DHLPRRPPPAQRPAPSGAGSGRGRRCSRNASLHSPVEARDQQRHAHPASGSGVRTAVKRIIATIVYLIALLGPIRWCHFPSQYLIISLGAVLALDRYSFQLLPWKRPINWRREIVIRGGTLTAGTAGFYLVRLGSVPWWEAFTLGVMASLVVLLLQAIVAV